MTWYAVYETATGRLLSTGTVIAKTYAELTVEGKAKKEFAFYVQAGTKQWNETTLDFDDIIPPKPKITTKEFWRRFTPSEREDLHEATRVGSPAVKKALHAFIEYIRVDNSVDLEDSYTVDRVSLMETAGLIGAGRAAEILA